VGHHLGKTCPGFRVSDPYSFDTDTDPDPAFYAEYGFGFNPDPIRSGSNPDPRF
jgi:hypothetical protein